MNLRTIVAAIAGAIVMFLLGFLFFAVLLESFFKEHMAQHSGLMAEPPRFVFIFLWNFVLCWLLAFIFDSWASIKTLAAGAKGGAMFFGAITLGVQFSNYAFMNMYKGDPWLPMLVDVVVVAVMGAITGGIIALILGKMSKG